MPAPTPFLHHSPSNPKFSDALLILSVLVIASCGLAYELIAGALASYVLGDSVMQFSTVIGTYLFAMGVGSHLSKYVPQDKLLQRFVEVEILVGLLGGVSAIGLFVAFAWLKEFKTLLYMLVLFIGILVGMEIPLVMRIFHERKQAFSDLISRVLTFDYLGALVVSLLFPMVLAPRLGLARTAVVFGMLNVLVAGWTAWHFFGNSFGEDKKTRRYLLNRVLGVSAVLLLAMGYADSLVAFSEQKRFNGKIVYATSSPYQRLVVTERSGFLQLFLNGNLQFSTRDEYRYHEALIHPILQKLSQKSAVNVLVLGGGDGMAVREILKYPNVSHVTLVDLDKKMTDTFAQDSRFTRLNGGSLTNAKVSVVNEDAFRWLDNLTQDKATQTEKNGTFEAIIIDLPDPSEYSIAKLYTTAMYQMVRQHLAPDGYVVIQATSPYYAPHAFWSIEQTLMASGFTTTPYHLYVPSFGEWGFIIANHGDLGKFAPPSDFAVKTQYLTPSVARAMFEFPPDMQPLTVSANTLDKQPLVRYYLEDWGDE